MSFKLFVYYCALCGAWAGFFAWACSLVISRIPYELLKQPLIGCVLGLFIAAAISFVDALLSGKFFMGIVRAGVAVVMSLFGAMLLGFIGQFTLDILNRSMGESSSGMLLLLSIVVTVITWVIVGVIIGGSIGLYDMMMAMSTRKNVGFAISKVFKGCGGGAVGGLLGGFFLAVCESIGLLSYSKRAMGFVILGMCIGLLIGLAQVILKEAWVRVEQGFRPGRELMLVKDETVIGRAEGSDLGIYGDNGVERKHARIMLKDGRYLLYDEETPGGTFVNDQRISGPTPLRSGDLIRLGRNVLVFGERAKRPA